MSASARPSPFCSLSAVPKLNATLPSILTLALCLAAAPTVAQPVPSSAEVFSQHSSNERFDLFSQPETNDQVGAALAAGDFGGSGFLDLAIGVPREDYLSNDVQRVDAGWTHVIEGSATGLDASVGVEDAPWDQDGDIQGGPESGDLVGWAVAVGDFDGDGWDDLVMGAPGESVGGENNTGCINVIYGSPNGLTTAGNRQLWQSRVVDGGTVPGAAEADDRFGHSLAVGNFNGDLYDDLAIGVPDEDVFVTVNRVDAGGIVVLYGSADGLTPVGSQGITRNAPGMVVAVTAGDEFGYALAAGDFDGDTFDDLAIGARYDDEAGHDRGSVDILYGSASGLDTTTHEVWHLDSPGIDYPDEQGEELGAALATGDFDADGRDDLAIGVPNHDGGTSEEGRVLVLYGSSSGITTAGHLLVDQDTPFVAGEPEEDDNFGQALAAGDLDGDGADELIVGIPGERYVSGPANRDGAGAAQIFQGAPIFGLDPTQNQILDYSLVGDPALSDGFATALLAADFDASGTDDLAFTVPRRLVRDQSNQLISAAGEIVVVYSAGGAAIFVDGFESGDTTRWSQSVP